MRNCSKKAIVMLVTMLSNLVSKLGHGNAVSLPQNNHVGTRHCRVLISGNVNSDVTGFDVTRSPVAFAALHKKEV